MTNTLIAAGPGVDAHYDKIHLYDAFGFAESGTVAPGHEPVIITVDGVTVGLTLCYDIRFPELYVELAARGAQLITVHASWGTGPGKLEQWTLLARARAIDTRVSSPRSSRPTPATRSPRSDPPGSAAAWWRPRWARSVSAGADPQLLVADIDLDAAEPRETIAVCATAQSSPKSIGQNP